MNIEEAGVVDAMLDSNKTYDIASNYTSYKEFYQKFFEVKYRMESLDCNQLEKNGV